MTKIRRLSGLFTVLAPLALAASAAAQGSDNCSTAQAISGAGPFAFDLTTATTGTDGQSNLACNFNGSAAILDDVWYHWTAPSSGTYVVTTALQTTVDTKIAIYSGTSCPPSNPISCNDDSGSAQAVARMFVTAGQTLLIQLGTSPYGTPGTGTFRILLVASSSADDCSTPAACPTTGMYAFDNSIASTGTQGQSNPLCTQVHYDLWFQWTAPSTGMAHLATCGQTDVDTAIAVYAASGCPTATAIACDDDGCALQSSTQWLANSGTTYMLQIGGAGGASGGWGTFTITIDPPPSNDDCATPLAIGPGGTGYDNTAATTGSQGQSTACGPILNDLWFTWTATTSGTATVETCFQTASNTILAVYAGAGCPAAAELGCNDDACGGVTSSVTVPISVGMPYTVQVGTPPGSLPGPASFTITETPGGGPITPYCFGDGTGTACPCGNNGAPRHGCANSVNPAGARLVGNGVARVSADTLVLSGNDMPPNSTAVYYQATTEVNNGAGAVFGDGLRCAIGSPVRLATKTNDGAGASGYGGPLGDVPISVRGGIPPTGATRDYQIYYRNPQAFCTSATFNLSNGLEAIWSP